MDANDDALKEFLGMIPRGGQEVLVVRGEAAHQCVGWFLRADGTWVDVFKVDAFRDVNLSAAIDGFLDTFCFVERC